MGKQSIPRKMENVGKGKVTPVQVAFIVDRYLFDNNFTRTRSSFRIEASQFISKSPVQEAPKSLLSLGEMLDEYICLKEQKVILDQEKYRVEQEKFRVQTLLKGMQDAMNTYCGGAAVPSLPPPVVVNKQTSRVHRVDLSIGSPANTFSGYPSHETPAVVMPTTKPSIIQLEPTNYTPITNQPSSRKRNIAKDLNAAAHSNPKRSRSQTSQLPTKGTNPLAETSNPSLYQESAPHSSAGPSPTDASAPTGSPFQGSRIVKCLINEAKKSQPSTSSDPKTPSPTQNEKSVSPQENLTPTSNHAISLPPQNFTLISSETNKVSPSKKISCYSTGRNHCISPSPVKTHLTRFSKRDHIKGRLDFDGSDAAVSLVIPNPLESLSEQESDLFDFDLPGFDGLGTNYSLSDLLGDFDIDGEDFYCQPEVSSSPGSNSGSPDTPVDSSMNENQVLSGFYSTMTEILSEKDMNLPGSESVTSMKSLAKCIKILSPAKIRRSPSQDQENLAARR